MHSIAEIGSNVPAFLGKLWNMVEDPDTDDLISWSSTGNSFVIKDEIRFARELLPMYYKHNNMASFIRQLNMYGFHKIVSPDAGSMNLEAQNEIKFTHPFFVKGHPYWLENIKRKIGVSKLLPGEKTPQVINKVLTDVRQMKGRQENLDSRLTAMKLENGALWRELSLLRQKHIKQQQIVNKLIQFLVTIVQQNHSNFTVKRKYPRMLQHHDKSSKISHSRGNNEATPHGSKSPMGPIIHELDPAEALLEDVVEEAEAETVSSEETEYYLNQSSEQNEESNVVVDAEVPEAVEFRVYDDECNDETIIGIPEDAVIPSLKIIKTQQTPVFTSVPMEVLNRPKKHPEISRPKFLKVITKRPKAKTANKQKMPQRQVQLKDSQHTDEKNLKLQIRANQQQIEQNQIQIERDQQQVQEQKYMLKSQQQQLRRNHQQFQKNQQRLQKNSLLQRGQLQQLNNNQQQGVLLQQIPQQPQPPPIITIPFDSGTDEGGTTTLEPIFLEDGSEQLSIPVEVVLTSTSEKLPDQPAPNLSPSQDMLLGSPMDLNDPVLTPQCGPVVTPINTPPDISSDMQVACVPDEQASPSLVTRSAHLLNEMDSHVESVHSDLESLKELLKSEGISLDANTLLGYFNDDPLSYNISDPFNEDNLDRSKETSGNELTTYNPSLLDLTDLMGNDWLLQSPSDNVQSDDSYTEVNTPQFVPQSLSYPSPSKKRKT